MYLRVSQKKVFLKLNYLGAKNENIAKIRPFCEKINSLGQFLDIPQMDFNSEKYFFLTLLRDRKNTFRVIFVEWNVIRRAA
jgi:hypothetical protein